jgi:hypothetical protein
LLGKQLIMTTMTSTMPNAWVLCNETETTATTL